MTLSTLRETFSINQPGICDIDDNRKVPGAECVTPPPPATGGYLTSGSMTKTLLAPAGLIKRDTFILDYTIGAGGEVLVEFYNNPSLSGSPLYSYTNTAVIENLSSYIGGYTGDLYLRVTVVTKPAEVRSYKITYESDSPVPSFTFAVKVKKV